MRRREGRAERGGPKPTEGRQNQPDAAQWQSLITLLGQDATWDQKLKWTLPLIPGILTYESEANLNILHTLREAWERLRNRVKKRA